MSNHSDHQYKYQFRKWNWSRKVGKDNMPRILKHITRRAEAGKSSVVTLEGRAVEPTKIRRALKEEKRTVIDAIKLKESRNRMVHVNERVLPFANNL